MSISRRRTIVITAGIMLSLFLASMESTVVSTAMPTIVGKLGGLSIYSWAFAAYMITSTTATPIYGKLSDVLGRKRVYLTATALFLLGSLLCGTASSMEQLVLYRALQGLGAGGLLALAFIMVGDLFTIQQRARIQGLFSSVWGLSSIVGPLIGGFIVDKATWQWVFFLNLIPGLAAAVIVGSAWRDPARRGARAPIDFAGAGLLALVTVALLLGLEWFGQAQGWALLAVAGVGFAALIAVERRAADPILPIRLFGRRVFAVGAGHGLLAGWAMFGSLSFVPLFVQAVLGTSATEAGTTLAPMMLGWVSASVLGSRLLLSVNFRRLALTGMLSLVIGSGLLSLFATSQLNIMIFTAMMGIGMGLSVPAFLIATQSSVERRELGTATSTLQFSRSIGGALGVNVMGAVLAAGLAQRLTAAGLDPAAVQLESLLSPIGQSGARVDGALRTALGGALQSVFVIGLAAAVIGFAVTALAPAGRVTQLGQAAEPATKADEAREPAPRPEPVEQFGLE